MVPLGVAFLKPTDDITLGTLHIPNFTEVLCEEAAQPHVIKHLLLPSYVCINRSSYSRGVEMAPKSLTPVIIGATESHSLPETLTTYL